MGDSRRTLVLVDLDNVAENLVPVADLMPSARPRDDYGWLRGGERLTVPTSVVDEPECVVVFGLNTNTAMNAPPDLASRLEQVARRFAHLFAAASTCGVEIGLTLSAPQAVDALLLRLVMKSPLATHAGRFARVFLLSGDRGLRRTLEADVLGRSWTRAGVTDELGEWTTRGEGVDRRGPPEPAPPQCAAADVDPQARNVLVNTPGLALWAATEHVDLAPELSLQQVGVDCRRRPGLLAQIGPTTSSVRGLARLGRLVRGDCRVIGCARDDGLELRCLEVAPASTYRGFAASRLGPGALRVDAPAWTVTSRIPYVVAEAAGAVTLDAEGGVHLRQTLGYLVQELGAKPDALGGRDEHVDLDRRGAALKACVRAEAGKAPTAWWVRGMTQEADPRCEGLGLLVEHGNLDRIAARCAVLSAQLVVLRAAPCERPVTLERAIPAQRLGLGVIGERRYAVFAPRSGLLPGNHTCVAIQEADELVLARNHPDWKGRLAALRELPIVVPKGIA